LGDGYNIQSLIWNKLIYKKPNFIVSLGDTLYIKKREKKLLKKQSELDSIFKRKIKENFDCIKESLGNHYNPHLIFVLGNGGTRFEMNKMNGNIFMRYIYEEIFMKK